MDLSMLLAQVLGVVYLAAGLGMLLNGDYYKKAMHAMVKDGGMMYLGGFMALVMGFFMVTYHNVWEGWPILVTLIGWLALIKGLALLIFPQGMMDWSATMMKHMANYSYVTLALGAVFAYFGFFA